MRRPILLTLTAVGGVITLLGATGIFAALTDTARSGTNSIEADALPPSSDLQVAASSTFPHTCGTFTDDLVSPLITISGPPGVDTGQVFAYCVRNMGSQTVTVTALAEEFTDEDIGCTGDETLFDPTCGLDPLGFPRAGELGNFVRVNYVPVNCQTGLVEPPAVLLLLRDNQTTPASLGTLAPGQGRCFINEIYQSSATETQRQQAQSDRLTWRFAWTGQA